MAFGPPPRRHVCRLPLPVGYHSTTRFIAHSCSPDEQKATCKRIYQNIEKKKEEKKKNMLTSVHGEMTYFEVFNIALIIQQYL